MRGCSLESSQCHGCAALGGDGTLLSFSSEDAARHVQTHYHELARCPKKRSRESQLYEWSSATSGRSNSLEIV